MRIYGSWCLGFLVLVLPARAAEPQGKTVQDIWNLAYLNGGRAGYVHTIVRSVYRAGQEHFQATTELRLTLLRNKEPIQLRMETGSEETADGKVVGVSMRQFQGNQSQVYLRGSVANGYLEIKVDGAVKHEKKVAWDDQVIGLYRQERLFQERKVKPGDKFSYLSFEPTLNTVVNNRVNVQEYEKVELLGVEKNLLRVESTPDKIDVSGTSVQMPGLTTWLDKDLMPVRTEFEVPGLGKLLLYRTTQERVFKNDGPLANSTDIYQTSLIPLNRRIALPNPIRSAVYRITIKGEEEPASTFASDSRQECQNVQGNTIELRVRAQGIPERVQDPGNAKDEYLKSCFWINSDDAKVVRYAREAIDDETDPWERAKRVEKWVHQHMRISFKEPFAPAGEVARTLRGDCRQHGLLTTAMCRAAGVPARTAIGLCYAEDKNLGPVMAFHMWTEVWIEGCWIGLDATRGQGYVPATHIKITDHSWHNTQSLTPLLPVVRVLGKLSIEIVSINGRP